MTIHTDKDRIINAALQLAADLGWPQVSLSDIAREAEITLAELSDYIDDKSDIVRLYNRRLDKAALIGREGVAADESPRDALFDLLMDRFEAMNENRPGLISILNSFKLDPKQALIGLPQMGRSMVWMLEAAGMETDGIRGCARVTGLLGIYAYALKAWMDDDSADLAKTMAAIDKGLSRAEGWASSLGL